VICGAFPGVTKKAGRESRFRQDDLVKFEGFKHLQPRAGLTRMSVGIPLKENQC